MTPAAPRAVVIIAILALTLAALTPPRPAAAQPASVQAATDAVVFDALTPVEALRKARRLSRLLIVYSFLPRSPEAEAFDAKMWTNPTLALYIRQHAVIIRQPTGTKCKPVRVFVIKDCLIRDDLVDFETCDTLARITVLDMDGPGLSGLERALPDIQVHGKTVPRPLSPLPGPAELLLKMDFALERLRAADPVWFELHERRNPPPPPPPPLPPLHLADDGLAEIIEDPPDAEVDVWDRLESARRAAGVGNLHAATGLYTWIWERADELDPAFAPARRSFLAGEIADLAARRDPCRERFALLRDDRARRLLWADYDDFHEWCVLAAISGHDDFILEWLGCFMGDPHEATMLPRADKAAYDLLLARERFTDPWELGDDPAGRVKRLAALLRARRPDTIPPDDWQRLQDFIAEHLFHEACRLHAACLRAGRDDLAQAIAATLLAARDTPQARYALVTTALVAGVPHPMHTPILDEADAAATTPRPDLRQRLTRALNGEPPHR